MEIKNNKRIINARPIFLIFLGLIFGIYFVYKSYQLNDSLQFNFALVFLILCVLVFIVWLVLYFIKKDNMFFAVIKRDFKYILCFTIALIIGSSIAYGSFHKYFNLEKYDNYECLITGTVEEVSTWSIVLSNCEINDGERLYSDVIIETNGDEFEIVEGQTISLLCNLSLKPIFRNNLNLSKFINGCAYTAAFKDELKYEVLSENATTLAGSFRDYVKNVLFTNMNEENAGISFAMLFGKKDFIPNNNLNAFSMAGISHILAVSGLHIGVLVAVLYFVFKKVFKSKSLPVILVLGVFLIFYSYLCEFSASVVRATIMSLVLLISREYGYRYDGLNSLSVAGIIILLLSPLSLFSAGFQLSFLCIFAIISLAPFITSLFKKIKIPEKLASALAISLSTNILILPVCANLFNKLSIISIFANLIIIPFFSICFVILFGVVLISCIVNPLGFLLIVPEVGLHGIKILANLFASVQSLYVTLFSVSYILLFLVVLLSFFVHFLMINKRAKGILCGSIAMLMLGILILANLPLNFSKNGLVFCEFSSNNISLLVTEDDKINLIGYNRSEYSRENFLVKNKVRKISTILAYNFEFNMLNSLEEFVSDYDVERILLPKCFKSFVDSFQDINAKIEFIEENSTIGKFKLLDYEVLNKSFGIELFNDDTRLLFANVSSDSDWAKLINRVENKVDIMFIENFYYSYENFDVEVGKVICNTSTFTGENITKLIYENDFTMEF